jgi:D-galactarolactone cycloisomerase
VGDSNRPDVRITGVNVYRLEGRLGKRFGWSLNWIDRRTATLVEVTTDAGLTGWGDGGFPKEVVPHCSEAVIGRSPFEVEAIYDEMRPEAFDQQRPGQPTAGGLDVALWDVVGQALGKPIWSLLGKKYRDRVRPYLTALYRKDRQDLAAGLAEEARGWLAQGYTAMKMKIGYGPDLDVEVVGAVREAIGGGVGLAVDSNCAYDAGTAVALGRRLEEFNLMWWEEPILANDLVGYRRLKDSLRIPLAGGETLPVDQLVRDYIQPRLVDILQPEVELVGLTGARRLSWLCWLNHIRLIPHNWGTALRTAAILHWMSTVPPLTEAIAAPPVMFEFDQTENPLRDAVIQERLRPGEDGMIEVPNKPGLGVTVIPEAVREFAVETISIR